MSTASKDLKDKIHTQTAMMRRMVGIVVKKSADKTVSVLVARMVVHPKYKKRYQVHRHYLVHDPKNSFAVGDKVVIQQCRPISKLKKWRVVEKEV